MQVTYTGPDVQVTLAPAYGAITFPNGEPVDVPDELGRRLVEQATFRGARPAGDAKKRRPNTGPTETSTDDDDVQDRG